MNIYVYISKNYLDYNYIGDTLKALRSFNIIISDVTKNFTRTVKNLSIPVSIIPKDQRYNFIRDESFAVLLFYDYEDETAQKLLQYCQNKSKLIMVKALPNEEFHV
jgi:uncharacterized phage-like protein YoqJ